MPSVPSPKQNHLLNALPSAVGERLFPHLKLVSMARGAVVYESGAPLRQIYFPTDCVISLLYVLVDGSSAEISVVGNEGAVGLSLFIGGETTTSRAIVQSAGSAYQLSGRRLRGELESHGDMLHILLRYSQSLLTQMAQTAVCNRHHSVNSPGGREGRPPLQTCRTTFDRWWCAFEGKSVRSDSDSGPFARSWFAMHALVPTVVASRDRCWPSPASQTRASRSSPIRDSEPCRSPTTV